MRRRLFSSMVAFAVLASASLALGDDTRKEAEKFFRAGEQAYNNGQYLLAAEAFEEAYTHLQLPAIAFSTAQAHRLQYFVDRDPRRLKRAIELYRRYVEEVKKGGRREDAATHLADLEPVLARLESQGQKPIGALGSESPTRMMISSNVKNARASLAGAKPVGLPLVRPIEPGTYKVVVTARGYFPKEQEYTVVEGQFRAVEVNLTPKPALVRVKTSSGAQIVVDGRPAGTAPLMRPLELDAGVHLVTVIERGRRAWSKEISVERGQNVELDANLRRTLQRKISYAVLGTAAATLLLSGVAGMAALDADGDASELEDKRQMTGLDAAELVALEERIEDRDTAADATSILFGVGTGLAVTGALLYFMDTPRAESYEPPPPGVAVTPVVSGDVTGLSLSGRF